MYDLVRAYFLLCCSLITKYYNGLSDWNPWRLGNLRKFLSDKYHKLLVKKGEKLETLILEIRQASFISTC